jgi:tetratricopeptide (TPR) repeat protein
VGTNKFGEALRNYEAAAKSLAEDEENFDDARCDLAMLEAKIGSVLLKMRRVEEARTHYEKALEKAKLDFSAQHDDFPALYAAAEAFAGMGDVSVAQARAANGQSARTRLWSEASISYQKSLDVWKRIPNPSRLSGNDYLATAPAEVTARLAACNSELQRLNSK